MASIPEGVLKLAARLYQHPGATWQSVANELRMRGHRIAVTTLVTKIKAGNYLELPRGYALCADCKETFIAGTDADRGRTPKCPSCNPVRQNAAMRDGFNPFSQMWLSRKL